MHVCLIYYTIKIQMSHWPQRMGRDYEPDNLLPMIKKITNTLLSVSVPRYLLLFVAYLCETDTCACVHTQTEITFTGEQHITWRSLHTILWKSAIIQKWSFPFHNLTHFMVWPSVHRSCVKYLLIVSDEVCKNAVISRWNSVSSQDVFLVLQERKQEMFFFLFFFLWVLVSPKCWSLSS